MSAERPGRLAILAVRLALLSFPATFRHRFQDSILETFALGYRDAGRVNAIGAMLFTLRSVGSFIAAGIEERVAPSFDVRPRTARRKTPMGTWLDLLAKDTRFAVRGLVRRPGFTILAAATLALGVGASSAIFSVVNGVLLKPLPYAEPDGLVRVLTHWSGAEGGLGSLSYPDLADLEALSASIDSLVGVNQSRYTLTGIGEPVVMDVTRVTKGLLETFLVAPALGRDIRGEEFGPEAPAVVVLSNGFWRTHFGGTADVIGKMLTLNGTPYEIVGVAPPGFDYPNASELWIPRRLDPEGCGRGCHTMIGIGRLSADASIAEAQADFDRIASNLTATFPDTNTNKGFLVRSLRDDLVGDVRPGLLLLLGAVGLVVLIAWANVANLLLVRASTRTGEIAIRTAIGASRARLVGQTLVESAVLAFLGGAAGIALTAGVLELLPHWSTGIPRMESIAIDANVLLFTLGSVSVCTLLFGAAPAFSLLRSPVRAGLGNAALGSGGETRERRRFRNVLLAAEMALSALLLVGAGLLLKSFAALYAVDVGFETRNIVRFSLILPEVQYDGLDKIRDFYRRLEDRIEHLPGVEAVGSVWGPPLGRSNATGTVLVSGRPRPAPEHEREASIHSVGPGFLETMRIAVVRGRGLAESDDDGPLPVAVINETFAHENFPGADPIGQEVDVTVDLGYGSPPWRIVGVVGDVRSRAIDAEPEAQIYVPHGHYGPETMTVTVRTAAGASVIPAAREILREMDPNVPMYRVETVSEALQREVAPTRFYLVLIAVFAGLAATLAAVGLYGVVSYAASRRTREIGLRFALGAPREGIVKMVLAQGLVPAATGLGIGLTAALFAGRVMDSVLFRVEPRDPWIFGSVSLLLFVVAVVATLAPAERASRIDPARALRSE